MNAGEEKGEERDARRGNERRFISHPNIFCDDDDDDDDEDDYEEDGQNGNKNGRMTQQNEELDKIAISTWALLRQQQSTVF
ncbi:hypothetical protein niasHT_013056 [Heterodera trifolii]|uniref:Uncharacterized protein n=1 Tax=Heterodera trifolii TaxID=157864 RepID=A0ABD2LE97_9BILA